MLGDSLSAGQTGPSRFGGLPQNCLFAAALLLRICVGLSSYSGAGAFRDQLLLRSAAMAYESCAHVYKRIDAGVSRPPLYGDYEAQRHWMELTLHTPISDW